MGELVTGCFAGREPERIRMEQLFADLLDDYRLNGRKSLAHAKSRIDLHLVPSLVHVRAAEFTSDQIKRYVANRRSEKAADATINNLNYARNWSLARI
jgi:hypothetical protein